MILAFPAARWLPLLRLPGYGTVAHAPVVRAAIGRRLAEYFLALTVVAYSSQSYAQDASSETKRRHLQGAPLEWAQSLTSDQRKMLSSACLSAKGAFVGTVVSVDSEWRAFNFGTIITSRAKFIVDRALFGVSSEVTVSYFGGRVGETFMTSSEDPSFTVGERYFVLVAPVPDDSRLASGPSDLTTGSSDAQGSLTLGELTIGGVGTVTAIVGSQLGAIQVSPDTPLPPAAKLLAIWNGLCDEL